MEGGGGGVGTQGDSEGREMREDKHMEETQLKWGKQTVCMLVWMVSSQQPS